LFSKNSEFFMILDCLRSIFQFPVFVVW